MQELLPMPTMFLSVYSVHIYESSQKLTLNIILKSWFASSNILFVISIHQTTNFVSPNFFYEFFSVWAVEKDNTLFIGPKQIFSFEPMKSLFPFSTAQLTLSVLRIFVHSVSCHFSCENSCNSNFSVKLQHSLLDFCYLTIFF